MQDLTLSLKSGAEYEYECIVKTSVLSVGDIFAETQSNAPLILNFIRTILDFIIA